MWTLVAVDSIDRREQRYSLKPWGARTSSARIMGRNRVTLVAAHGDLMDLPAGAVHATYAHGTVRVENQERKIGAH